MKSENLVDSVCSRLFLMRTRSEFGGTYYPLIPSSAHGSVIETVEEALKSVTVDKISELEAKVFVYEEIIKKSNFAPMLKEDTKNV